MFWSILNVNIQFFSHLYDRKLSVFEALTQPSLLCFLNPTTHPDSDGQIHRLLQPSKTDEFFLFTRSKMNFLTANEVRVNICSERDTRSVRGGRGVCVGVWWRRLQAGFSYLLMSPHRCWDGLCWHTSFLRHSYTFTHIYLEKKNLLSRSYWVTANHCRRLRRFLLVTVYVLMQEKRQGRWAGRRQVSVMMRGKRAPEHDDIYFVTRGICHELIRNEFVKWCYSNWQL